MDRNLRFLRFSLHCRTPRARLYLISRFVAEVSRGVAIGDFILILRGSIYIVGVGRIITAGVTL